MFRGIGRGIRIRTLNDGVRVRSVTVTLYLYIKFSREMSLKFFAHFNSYYDFDLSDISQKSQS